MFGIGPWEIVLILVIALLVVGPRRLPELMRDLGKFVAQFRSVTDEMRRELQLDEEVRRLRETVHDLQDVSATAMRKMMQEVEEEAKAQAAQPEQVQAPSSLSAPAENPPPEDQPASEESAKSSDHGKA
ncbi:MAG: twin arginine-targeting protein translocase TatB [Deltaproteobacteria bacterium RBG_13_61_14]|nr:MAG: twin arginine-targeting protein translocase TatB [Deltaproteobacteria bacterium RBG_13_61_14]